MLYKEGVENGSSPYYARLQQVLDAFVLCILTALENQHFVGVNLQGTSSTQNGLPRYKRIRVGNLYPDKWIGTYECQGIVII